MKDEMMAGPESRAIKLAPAWLRMSPDDEAALIKLAKYVEFKAARTRIFEQSGVAGSLYLLVTGIVQVSRMLPDGERHIVAFHWPGDLFGLEETGFYFNTAETVTPCTVYELPVRKVDMFLEENPRVQRHVLVHTIHELRAAQRQMIVVGRLKTSRALAAFLLDCAQHAQYFNEAEQRLDLPMSRYDIADYLGTAPESVTRAFSRLENEGLLRRVTPRLLRLDLPGLRALANMD